jgi:formylglycine-generating enzyme required for sulfatase activity
VRKRIQFIVLLAATGLVLVAALAFLYWKDLEAWYEFRQRFESLGSNSSGAEEFRHRETGVIFIRIPAGRVEIGSPEGEEGAWAGERPLHEVRLDAFLIAKYEVSQHEWSRIMGTNPSLRGSSLPMADLSWHDCFDFNKVTGMSFPTEAHWERACRGATVSPFSFGELITTDDANFNGKYPYGESSFGEFREETVHVDALRPNVFGLHHVHGNVAEWCEDVYDEDFYKSPDATAKNPVCEIGSASKSVRGGSWKDRPRYCRSGSRSFEDPSRSSPTIGYRPVYRLSP